MTVFFKPVQSCTYVTGMIGYPHMTNAAVQEKIANLEGEIKLLKKAVIRRPDFESDEAAWRAVKPAAKKIRQKLYKKIYG